MSFRCKIIPKISKRFLLSTLTARAWHGSFGKSPSLRNTLRQRCPRCKLRQIRALPASLHQRFSQLTSRTSPVVQQGLTLGVFMASIAALSETHGASRFPSSENMKKDISWEASLAKELTVKIGWTLVPTHWPVWDVWVLWWRCALIMTYPCDGSVHHNLSRTAYAGHVWDET